MEKFEATGDGADRTATATRDLADGEALATVESEDGQKRGRVEVAGGVEEIEELKGTKAGGEAGVLTGGPGDFNCGGVFLQDRGGECLFHVFEDKNSKGDQTSDVWP